MLPLGGSSWTRRRAGVRIMDKTLRAGIFGIVIVACVLIVAFGYSSLPFYPQGKPYEAYFADAGGISPGNDVNVSGIVVGKVCDVALAGDVGEGDIHRRPQALGGRSNAGIDQNRHRAGVRGRWR